MEIQDSDPTSQTSCRGETSPAETRRLRSSAPIGPAACPSAPTIQYCFNGSSLGSSAREVGAPSNCEWQITRCSPQPGRSPTASPLTSAGPRANREGSRGRADWGSLPPPLRESPSRAGRSGPDEVQERSRWLGNGSENPAPPERRPQGGRRTRESHPTTSSTLRDRAGRSGHTPVRPRRAPGARGPTPEETPEATPEDTPEDTPIPAYST